MVQVEIKKDGELVGSLTAEEKTFKTGSRGFHGVGKMKIGEKRYQVQIQLVEIGSKPATKKEEEQ